MGPIVLFSLPSHFDYHKQRFGFGNDISFLSIGSIKRWLKAVKDNFISIQ